MEESQSRLSSKFSLKKFIEFAVIVVITAVIWNIPQESFGIDGLTVIQQRVIAIFVFATLSWLTEAIPSWATSLVIITSMCLTISNNSLSMFKGGGAAISANGTELAFTKGLKFTSGIIGENKIIIDQKDGQLTLKGKDIAFNIDSLHKGQTIVTTYVTDKEDKAYLTISNANMKEGEKNDSLSVVNSVVTKDGTVTFTNKGGLINLKAIAINDAGKIVRHWDFTNITDKDLKSLQSDAAIWSAASDKSGVYTNRTTLKGANFGAELKSSDIMATFANPIIILFLGGFILAIAATKSGLDVLLARSLIKPFGKKSENVLLGFLLITGVFSMFVSNTATAAMMLTFLTPVFAALPANGKGRIALTMSIPVAANLGGMATPIGTPPNAIALQALNGPELHMGIGFGQWMAFMFPLVIVLLLISWFILKKEFPFSQKTIELKIEGHVHHGWRMWVVCITFAVTILMWLFDRITGVDANTVALIPIAVFAITGVITAKDLQQINWSVIWMVAGGFALGLGMNGSGLATAAIASIPFGSWSPMVIMIISGLICYFLSNFISNTATAALLVPILAVVCNGMGDSLNAIGGTSTILMGIALSASAAMCLPISTPPNAIAYSTGLIDQKSMLKIGIITGVLTMVLGYTVLYCVGKMHFLG
jgi:sodium-dependent dicarboxylate transporter 2/3/5